MNDNKTPAGSAAPQPDYSGEIAAIVRRLLSLRHVRLRSGRKGPAWPTLIHVTSVGDDADDRDAEENSSRPTA